MQEDSVNISLVNNMGNVVSSVQILRELCSKFMFLCMRFKIIYIF
jgi:hypothetical protein